MDFKKMSKSQKTLCGHALLYIAYGAMFIGAPLGLEDSGLKFTGVKAGPIFQAAADWGGIGAIFLGLDNIFVALKCSKEMIQRTVSLNAIGCFIRLGVSITAGSQKWGGVHVHKEYLQGIAITVSNSRRLYGLPSRQLRKSQAPLHGMQLPHSWGPHRPHRPHDGLHRPHAHH